MRNLTRLFCLVLTLLTLCSAACAEDVLRGYDKQEGYVYLTLGTFPQTAEGERQPILWRVLSVADGSQPGSGGQPGSGKAFILSEYVLEARPLHGDYKQYANKPTNKSKPGFEGDYTQTDMANYLNGDFTANFAAGELTLIAPDETLGMFFLLSGDELKNKDYGFDSNESRKAWGTDYAKANGLFVYMAHRGSHSPYWTRTQSTSNKQGARCIKSKGELGYITVTTPDEGVRPACWLDLQLVHILSGTGTMEDPYVLAQVVCVEPTLTPVENAPMEE